LDLTKNKPKFDIPIEDNSGTKQNVKTHKITTRYLSLSKNKEWILLVQRSSSRTLSLVHILVVVAVPYPPRPLVSAL